MALTAQDLRNGLHAIEQLTFKGSDCAKAVALMDRYRAEIALVSAPPPEPEADAKPEPKAKTDLVPTNGKDHSPDA